MSVTPSQLPAPEPERPATIPRTVGAESQLTAKRPASATSAVETASRPCPPTVVPSDELGELLARCVSASTSARGVIDAPSLQRMPADARASAFLTMQRSLSPASECARTTASDGTRVLQRNKTSEALLEELAKPKVLEFDNTHVGVQKDIVDGLEATIAGQKQTLKDRLDALEEVEEDSAEVEERFAELFGELSVTSDDEDEDEPRMTEAQAERFAAITRASEAIQERRAQAEDAVAEATSRRNRWDNSLMVLGGIELTSLPDTDAELLRTAELIDLPGRHSLLPEATAFDLVEKAGVKDKVVANTLNTMIEAKQVEYLRKSGLVGGDWTVLIEVHYYRSREQSRSQFHKDTLGQTLFVNLNYHNADPIAGPEYVLHPPTVKRHETQIATTLPPEFLSDLGAIRDRVPTPRKIKAPTIGAYGAVAFVDETIHHMTPLRGHRTVTGSDFKNYLDAHYPETAQERRPLKETWEKWVEMSQQGGTTYTRPDLLHAGMSKKEISALLAERGDSGFQTVSIPYATDDKKALPIAVGDKPLPLKRQMSKRALANKLPPPVTGERRFFRTWVRAVRRS